MKGANQKYFMAWAYRHGTKVPLMVWNGIDDYTSHPHGVDPGFAGSQRIGIVQISRRVGMDGRPINKTIRALPFDGIILWARNVEVYQSIVEEIRSRAVANLDCPMGGHDPR